LNGDSARILQDKMMRSAPIENLSKEDIMKLLETVCDPEIPVLSIVDLGIVRDVEFFDKRILISITPTYTGCPAMKVIEDDIIKCLFLKTDAKIEIKTVFFPVWSTDWIPQKALNKLMEYGISPPEKTRAPGIFSFHKKESSAICPLCKSNDTVLKSFFGSTACKSLYFCNTCSQPFEHFKCI
jgi:ring-1,2-phenylacetyl-CoA epoxidase subunit PaaD